MREDGDILLAGLCTFAIAIIMFFAILGFCSVINNANKNPQNQFYIEASIPNGIVIKDTNDEVYTVYWEKDN